LLSSLKKRYVFWCRVCIVFWRKRWFSMWNRWLLQWQSEQPKPLMGLPFWLMFLAVLHSSVLSACLKKALVIFTASLSSK